MTTNTVEEPWRRELNDRLRSAYEALPEPLKTTYRKGEALKSVESFVECYSRLLNRAKNQPRIVIAGCPDWEMWLHYSGAGRPEGEPLYIEIATRRDEEGFGELVERDSLMGYIDLIGESKYPADKVWWVLFGDYRTRP